MKLDSGAQHTIVSRTVLPKALPTGGTVRLKGATGMQVDLLLTEIDFNFDGQVLTKVVAVSDILEEDAFLGTDLPIFNDLMRNATEERAQALPAVMTVTIPDEEDANSDLITPHSDSGDTFTIDSTISTEQ